MAMKNFYIDHKFTDWERIHFTADEEDIPKIIEDIKKGDYTKCEVNAYDSERLHDYTDDIDKATIADEPTLKLYHLNGTFIAED